MDRSSSAGGTTGREGEDLAYTARLYESLNFSCFRFYLCLFSGPSTFLPKVRDPEFSGVSFGFLSCETGPSTCGKGLGLVGTRPFGVGQMGLEISRLL